MSGLDRSAGRGRPALREAVDQAVNWIGEVGIRPEALRLEREAPLNRDKRLDATVLRCVFLGNCVHAHVRLSSGQEVTAEIPRSDEVFRPGESVYACWRDSDEMVFP